MSQGIAAFRLDHKNEKFLVLIDDETWVMEADGRTEYRGNSKSPCEVAGTRVDTLDNLPNTVRESIAARCEVLDGAELLEAQGK